MYKYERTKFLLNDKKILSKYLLKNNISDKLDCIKSKWSAARVDNSQGFDNECFLTCPNFKTCSKVMQDKDCVVDSFPITLNTNSIITNGKESPMVSLYIDNMDINAKAPDGFLLAKNIYDAKRYLKKYKIDILIINYDTNKYRFNKFLSKSYDLVNDICINKYSINKIYINNSSPTERLNMFNQLKAAQSKDILSKDLRIYNEQYAG